MHRLLVLLVVLLSAPAAWAHSMSSAQWRLSQVDAQTWDSRLRLPEDFEGRLMSLKTLGPVGCERLGETHTQPAEEGLVMHWRLRCPQGLQGPLGLEGFTIQLSDAVLLLQPLQGAPQYAVLSAVNPQWTPQQKAAAPPVPQYLVLGVEHILLGVDHLLFVLGLFLLWRRSGAGVGRLVGTLTAFTVAHSVTLAGAMLRGWTLPGGAVEACIAASILLLAVELATGARGLAQRRPAGIAFAFGLLHGFGFAGALAETGLPEQARGWALAAFNLGVEAGQLLFVLGLLAALRLLRPQPRWAPLALCAYGAVAAYWLIERSAAVLL
ncbi:HupE/UreJ family protein [Solimonas sp. K1W22B-7]|uniref:HupE/UreJ family protein n=1 Tax=Solimonas sp. K1W22B-7 TaxID=2303331 RepID=UPI000E337D06|nr:HupE/UreJ family protein [Solimonas sp. K1W22B-7]AXQ27775.1 HupE/UreJ family protein [Solimonas sp. K1W22B-7]